MTYERKVSYRLNAIAYFRKAARFSGDVDNLDSSVDPVAASCAKPWAGKGLQSLFGRLIPPIVAECQNVLPITNNHYCSARRVNARESALRGRLIAELMPRLNMNAGFLGWNSNRSIKSINQSFCVSR